GKQPQPLDLHGALHAGGIAAAQQDGGKLALDTPVHKGAADAAGLFFDREADVGGAAVGGGLHQVHAVVAELGRLDVPPPALQRGVGQVQPDPHGVAGKGVGQYAVFHVGRSSLNSRRAAFSDTVFAARL